LREGLLSSEIDMATQTEIFSKFRKIRENVCSVGRDVGMKLARRLKNKIKKSIKKFIKANISFEKII
jgi:hypothetical protein